MSNPIQAYKLLDSEANKLRQRWLAQSNFLHSDRALECDTAYLDGRRQEEQRAFGDYCSNIEARIRLLWEDMVTSSIAKLADARTRPSGASEGYEAERHPSMPELIIVWAPCGCYWVGPPEPERPFVTYCGQEACVFEWQGVKLALQAFKQAEASLQESLNKKETNDSISVNSSDTGGSSGPTGDSHQDGPAAEGAETAPTAPVVEETK